MTNDFFTERKYKEIITKYELKPTICELSNTSCIIWKITGFSCLIFTSV